MIHRTLNRLALVFVALHAAPATLAAEAFPARPIRVIIPSATGGQLDVTGRAVTRAMGDRLGQPFVVENRVGAGSLIGIRGVKASPADGYTLLCTVNTIAIQQALNQDPGYDVAKDFAGIGPLTRSPFIVVAAPSLPEKNMAEVIARAKANPGKLSYGSAGTGSTTHLSAAIFAQRAGIDMLHVPYKGNAAAWPDLLAGRIAILFEGYGSGGAMVRDGRLKVLGVTSTQRLEVLPDVPTIAESGAPGYSFYLWIGLFAPANTPRDVVQTLSNALRTVLVSAEMKQRFREEGSEAALMSPEEFDRFVRDDVATFTKLANDLKLPKQ